jgi:hypothetical protein
LEFPRKPWLEEKERKYTKYKNIIQREEWPQLNVNSSEEASK